MNTVQGVSDDGTVVGQLIDNKTQQYVAFTRSSSGTFTEYSAPQSSNTWLYGRNGSGTNAGSYQDNGKTQAVHGFLLQGRHLHRRQLSEGCEYLAVRCQQLGAASGSYSAGGSVTKGFVLANGQYTVIAYPNAQVTYALGINDNGEVVGSYASGAVDYGFAWENGTFTLIDYPKAKYGTVLTGVNNSGVIVGNHLSSGQKLRLHLRKWRIRKHRLHRREIHHGWRHQQQRPDLG